MFIGNPALLIPAVAAIAVSATQVGAQNLELPARKSGQWEIRMVPDTAGAAPDMTMQACIDETSDAEMMQMGLSMSKSMCSRQEMRRDGDDFVIDSTCQVGPMTTDSHVVVSGDFQSAYTVKITSQSSGPVAAMSGNNSMTQEAKWVAAQCTDGLSAGDMLMPGGIKMNVNDMMNMMGGG